MIQYMFEPFVSFNFFLRKLWDYPNKRLNFGWYSINGDRIHISVLYFYNSVQRYVLFLNPPKERGESIDYLIIGEVLHKVKTLLRRGLRDGSGSRGVCDGNGERRGWKNGAWTIGLMPYPMLCRPCRAIMSLFLFLSLQPFYEILSSEP